MSESVGLAPVQKRDIILEVRVRTVRGFRKVARAALVVPKGTTFTMVSDEGAYLQGEDTAPPPLSYFTASVAFWLMSQVSRYAAIRKIQLKDLRARAQARFHIEGSVLADTLHSRCDGIEIEIGFRSDADRETISHMLRTCENSCYVLQSLVNPISVRTVAMVNGQRLDLLAETTAWAVNDEPI